MPSSARVVVANVRTSLRRPRGPGVRTQTVSDALPMSNPATRSNNTSTGTPPRSAADGASTGGSSARKQTHALTAAIKGHPRTPRHTPRRAGRHQCVTTSPDDRGHSHPQGQRSRSQSITPSDGRAVDVHTERVTPPPDTDLWDIFCWSTYAVDI